MACVCIAYFYSVYPNKGPLEGGTSITFNASIVNEETRPTRVHFYDDTELVVQLSTTPSDKYEHDITFDCSYKPPIALAATNAHQSLTDKLSH